MFERPTLLGRLQGHHSALQETVAPHDERVPSCHALLQAVLVSLFLGGKAHTDSLPSVPDCAFAGRAGDGHFDAVIT
jgi:hypothetical protein